MTENSEILARLTALPDRELIGVLLVATAERPGFEVVHAALLGLVGAGDSPPLPGVTPATPTLPVHDAPTIRDVSGQVAGTSPVPAVPVPPTGTTAPTETGGYSPSGVPTWGSVRDKVEQRFGTAQGMGELDQQTPAGRSADEQWDAREKAARERLDQIRKSLRGNDTET
ncbi:hypothetical protein [Nocardia brasiliensis]|uniref:Uncharacterized protein n=1 Tax=Nocardia brasiliensis (strain ATCC 700358 / HUJEG-1) TaxID=1133849 RepID=K0EM06_NOCB7|nr:hypothetical protein [Nocardia brasiliensis]AFU00588.1 hypothetical protein O3I_013135 [Nocardia brasiliensis ATCC 700358]